MCLQSVSAVWTKPVINKNSEKSSHKQKRSESCITTYFLLIISHLHLRSHDLLKNQRTTNTLCRLNCSCKVRIATILSFLVCFGMRYPFKGSSSAPAGWIFAKIYMRDFDVLLTVHLIIFISVFNQLYEQMHETATYRCDNTRGYVMQFWERSTG